MLAVQLINTKKCAKKNSRNKKIAIGKISKDEKLIELVRQKYSAKSTMPLNRNTKYAIYASMRIALTQLNQKSKLETKKINIYYF